jgi:hypothetical protein
MKINHLLSKTLEFFNSMKLSLMCYYHYAIFKLLMNVRFLRDFFNS